MLSALQCLIYKRLALPFVSSYTHFLRLKLLGCSITISCVKNNILFSVIFFSHLLPLFLFYSVEKGQRTLTSSSHAHSHNWPLLTSWLSPTSTKQNSMDFPLSTLNSPIRPPFTLNRKKKEWMWIYLLPQNSVLTFTILSNKR